MIRRRAALIAGLTVPLPANAQPARAQPVGAVTQPAAPVFAPRQEDVPSAGFRRDVLARWGDPAAPEAPAWTPATPSADAAAAQFGWDCRVIALARPADGSARAVLAVAHPFVRAAMAFPGGQDRPELAAAMQGVTLVNLEQGLGGWVVAEGGFQSRRLGLDTLCRLAGGGLARGLLGVNGGCATPWGTLLLAEADPAFWQSRLAPRNPAVAEGTGFGLVAELDPFERRSLPLKRPSLGRFAHGDVAATLAADGRAVVYQTDRRAGGYLFRFTSAGPATAADALDAGTMAVARTEGTRLDWVDLPPGMPLLPAAAEAGGAGFDTPAGLGQDPRGARLLLACQGSGPRPAGHVIEITPANGDPGAPTARVLLLFAAGDPAGPGSYAAAPPPGQPWPENPASIAVDQTGRAWVGTDRGGAPGRFADGVFTVALDGPERGLPRPAYAAPRAGAIGGIAPLPAGEGVICGLRHPGAAPGARYEKPATRWPDFSPGLPPRSAVVLLRRG